MKILFMGSAAFAVPSLVALLDAGHDVTEVVAQPDKPAGRGMKLASCPVAACAKERGLELYQPTSVKKPDVLAHFSALKPDLIAIVAYGKFLPKELLDLPKMGCVNVHSSLLPKYRGAAPINWAIVNGERETGVTTMRINEQMDAGDILLSCSTAIDDVEDAVMLHARLAPMGAELLLKTIEGLSDGSVKPRPQDHSKATFAPIIKKEDGHIDWKMPARDIYNRVRGFKPWPGAFTKLDGKMLRIHEAAATDEDKGRAPGSIVASKKDISVACGKGTLYLLDVQLEGKKRTAAAEFLLGHRIKEGTVLG